MAINDISSIPKITKNANNSSFLLAKGRNWRPFILLPFFFLVNLLLGCSTLPTSEEYNLVKAHQRAIVLLRITSIADSKPHKPFHGRLEGDLWIQMGLASFETGGELKWVTPPRFLSEATREEGWTFFVLKPGTYYLAVLPPPHGRMSVSVYEQWFERAPRWRFDVPLNAKTVYIGTLHISGHAVGKKMVSFYEQGMTVFNEEDLAKKIASEHIRDFEGLETALMKRHEGPIILKTPKF